MRPAEASFSINLCADDFALSPGVSRGILEAIAAGRLSATSVMTTRPAWPEGARALKPFKGEVDIGLHLNLTLGAPLSLMPKFAPSGGLPGIGAVLRGARKSELPEAEIRQEISRQIDAFQEHFGAAPDFVDGHQHVQVLPQIRGWLLDALEEKGHAGKLWLRDSGDDPLSILRRGVELKKALALAWLSKGFAREARARGFSVNSGFSGFSSFDAGRDYAADFVAYLRAPGRRHLIMCHPGYSDEELVRLDPVTVTRERELAFLLSPAFSSLLAARGAKLASFGVIEGNRL
ncbi:ChbG/HpnK family deacetylase [Methylocapsa acidiphila]|uniref:ChbG/HpnK family deacetylase n=1 Tax=Methylocapsa acidiphila TaxID=133552 RepID=UPI0003FD37D4|nr:ChbG/HpnK family deacetylase [Methylocapsa acidiphila]